MVQIVADAGGDEDAEVFTAHVLPQMAELDHAIHHLGDAEAMAEIMERVVAVVLLHTQLEEDEMKRINEEGNAAL